MIVPLSEPTLSPIVIFFFVVAISFFVISEIFRFVIKKRIIKDLKQKQKIVDVYRKLYVDDTGEIPFNERKMVDMGDSDNSPNGVYYVTVVKEGDVILGIRIEKESDMVEGT